MLGHAKARIRQPEPKAGSDVEAIIGKGGQLDHRVIKRTPAMVGFCVQVAITVYTRNGEVEAEPGDLLIADRNGCWVVTPQL